VWFITGAGRGLGVNIARTALAAGHAVVGTARDAKSVTKALGEHDDLLAVALDVTDPTSAQAAVAASVERFGCRGVHGGPGSRGCTLRHPHHARRARLLPHRTPHPQSTHYAQPSIEDYAPRTT
jgi:hypothetical protein